MVEKISFGKKLSLLRSTINEMDWSPDGVNVSQNYKFLSNKKMKGNVSAALAKVGLEWRIQFSELQILPSIGERMGQHYMIKAIATIFDADNPNDLTEWIAYGEAADTADKGIAKAQTNAFKSLIANNLMVSEYDADIESDMESTSSFAAEGMSGYDIKKEVIKGKILTQNPAKPPEEMKKTPETTKTVTATQKSVMDKIVNKVQVVSEIDLVPFGTVDDIVAEYHSVSGPEQAAAFISKYKGVMSCQ